MKNPSFATRWNADLIDQQYAIWRDQPEALDPTWRAFFEGFDLAASQPGGDANQPAAAVAAPTVAGGKPEATREMKQSRFTGVIYAYRSIGHTQAHYNPLFIEVPQNPRLTRERLGFTEADLDEVYWTGNYLEGKSMSVRELFKALEQTYCGPIGVEYLHIQENPKRRWLQARMEPTRNLPRFNVDKKRRILSRVLQAEQFEKYLHTHYVGQKRFGLEGGETLIAALDAILEMGPGMGVKECVLGMAHRGRLNVLTNIIGKSYEYLFHEFSENYLPDTKHGDGDVKYHLGYDNVVTNTSGGEVTVRLAANPSHLEAVNPVVEGRARARQRILGDTENRKAVIPILIHGDAAFAGQGVVAEVLNFSQLPGYRTGGTIHFIINNQIGFTTDPTEARSTLYCTDVAKMIEAPIFHVNGDDPEAVVFVTELALEYRQAFGCDVVIDMYCYRRHGHNEADEPAFTQPTLYRRIADHPIISEVYRRQLVREGSLEAEEIAKLEQSHHERLNTAYTEMKRKEATGEPIVKAIAGSTGKYQPAYSFDTAPTATGLQELGLVARALTRFPDSFGINPKIKRQLVDKLKAFEGDGGIDWAFAEALSWGTLMREGFHVRLSGQDCVRGTFSQRHAMFYDTNTREKYIPLMEMEGRRGMLCVHNSLLSEAAVLGFDYGYSLDYPEMLTMWEAQFGDFVNGAQVLIDQFICSSESKWQRYSGIVLLLPHGYEGQGPEHSSGRPERFLQLCAEDNIQVCNLTTPAQYFHVLRRQLKRTIRKPLVIFSPKSLLRHRECVSKLAEFSDAGFQCILPDVEAPKKAARVILCTGKVYYDLLAHRREAKITDSALVRVEQLYPLHRERLAEIVNAFGPKTQLVWCQEEPQNMGAWTFLAPQLEELFGRKAKYAGRDAASSPAVGSLAVHKLEQAELVRQAFAS